MSLFQLCVGNIILVLGGYIPGFAVCFLLIDVLGRKPIQLMGFIILTILFWIMGASTTSSQIMELDDPVQVLDITPSVVTR